MQKAATALKARAVKGVVKADTVTLKHLAADLAESHSVPKSQMTSILTGMVESI